MRGEVYSDREGGEEGQLLILRDITQKKNEVFFKGAAYDDISTEEQVKEERFPADKGISGRVLKTGQPALVEDVRKDPDFYPIVDEQLQFHTHDILSVPLRGKGITWKSKLGK